MKNKIIDIAGASTGLVGALSPLYHGPGKQFIYAYLHDITLPFSAYFMYNLMSKEQSRLGKALYVFGGCSAFEVAQRFGLYHGTYDPKDFIAYATGAGLAFVLDKYLFQGARLSRKKFKSEAGK